MRYGKISQTAWKRFVGKQLHTEKEHLIFSPSPWQTCSGIKCEDEAFVMADAVISGESAGNVFYAVWKAAGDLAAAGMLPESVSVQALFPGDTGEEMLSELARSVSEVCGILQLQAGAVKAEVSPAVNCPVITVSVLGRKGRAEENKVKPGHDIVYCGCAGLEGMLRLAEEEKGSLRERFSPSFLAQTEALKKALVSPGQILKLREEGKENSAFEISAVRQVGSGGILAELWNLAEESGIGMEISLSDIALKQETVEICELFGLNPYQMTSAGSFLITTDHADMVIRVLEKAGARAGKLGVATAQKARVITSGEEVRYLDRPAPDELVLMQSRKRQK